jgi:hypothetical protein
MDDRRLFAATLLVILTAFAGFSCKKNTYLMYDTGQKPHLYFTRFDTINIPTFSMVTTIEDTYRYDIEVAILGTAVDYDRTFHVELHEDTMTSFGTKGVESQVVSARRGVDVTFGEMKIPAGSYKAKYSVYIHRQEVMKDKYVSALMTVGDDDNFHPMTPNYYRLLINDGDLPTPVWWTNIYTGSSAIPGWNRYFGKCYPEKYRRFLNLFWEASEEQPDFVQTTIDNYGEYLYADHDKNKVRYGFPISENAALWAHYVLIPLYDYYKANPIAGDSAFAESGQQGAYWQDPRGMIK